MFLSIRARLLRFGPWPRRVAALCCLALAAISAFAPTGARTPDAKAPTTQNPPRPDPAAGSATTLPAGQVAVAVRLADGGAGAQFLRPGDRVDLIAGRPADVSAAVGSARAPAPISGVQVLTVRAPPAGGSGPGAADQTDLVVALSRAQIGQLADFADRMVFAARDNYP